MKAGDYSAPVPRILSLAVGLAATLIGAGLLALICIGGYRMLYKTPPISVTVILCIVMILGLVMLSWGFRLVSNRPRREGGLLSPWVLRIGGVLFFVAPIAMYEVDRPKFSLEEAGAMLFAGISALVIAGRRSRHES